MRYLPSGLRAEESNASESHSPEAARPSWPSGWEERHRRHENRRKRRELRMALLWLGVALLCGIVGALLLNH